MDKNIVTELRKKYSDVLNKRIEARKLINELEQQKIEGVNIDKDAFYFI